MTRSRSGNAQYESEKAGPTMKFVATKTADQLDLQALHRVRERLVRQRTGIINQIRAFLLERGIAVRQGLRFLRAELPSILAKRSDVLSQRMMRIIVARIADAPLSCHPHFKWRRTRRKAIPEHDNQCPLVKSRNIAELQHLAMTRRVGELGFLLARPRGFEPLTFAFGGGSSALI